MRRNQKGSAMIVVICVLVLTMALGLALLLTASVLITNAVRSNNKEQCRINAVTMSDLLIDKIDKGIIYDASTVVGDIKPDFNAEDADSSLEGKLKTVYTSKWKKYTEDKGIFEGLGSEWQFTYRLKECGLPGDTIVELYFVSETENYFGQSDPNMSATDIISDFENIILYVKVTSTVGEETASIINSFEPNVSGEWESWKWNYRGRVWEGQEENELGKGDQGE